MILFKLLKKLIHKKIRYLLSVKINTLRYSDSGIYISSASWRVNIDTLQSKEK